MTALTAALMLALGGCATQAGTPPAATTTSTASSSATAAPSPTATFVVLPDAATTYGPACVASQVTLSWGIDASSGVEMGKVTNTSNTACSVFGFPGAQLLDAQRQPMTTRVSQATSGPWSGVSPEQKLQVAPGASVYLAVVWSATPSGAQESCAASSYLALTLPGDSSAVAASDPIQACGGAITISPFQPAPFMGS